MLTVAILANGCATTEYMHVRMSENHALQRRVVRLGEVLSGIACRTYDCSGTEWRFVVLDQNPFGAIASHDGIIAVDAGLAGTLRIDELAWLLGHEIGHVVRRHGGRGNRASATGGGVVLVGTLATIPFAPWWVPLGIFFGGDAVREVSVAAYSRSLEEEADAFGVWLTIAASYPSDAGERALTRIHEGARHRQPWFSVTLLATHPDLEDRIAFVQREAARYER